MFITHHLSHTKEYFVWNQAKQRCHRPSHPSYPNYGARGITMCDEWRNDFAAFIGDMGPCPDGLTLERIDNDGNYDPVNCRWASQQAQSRNKRRNIYITHDGDTLCIADWAKRLGISYRTIATRHSKGQPIFERRTNDFINITVTHDGRTLTMKEWSCVFDIPVPTLRDRYKKGKPLFAPIDTKYSSRLRG